MKRGFTMIELIVVIAIIGVLSSIVSTQFSSAQKKSRDAKRLSDVNQIKKALELYQVGYGNFPIHTEVITITGDDAFSTTLETAKVITEVPKDPAGGYNYTYQSSSSGHNYFLKFCLETSTIPNYLEGCENIISP